MVPLAGGELLARGEHVFPPCGGVVEDAVHRQQGHDAQHLLGAGELRGQQDGLWDEDANVIVRDVNILYRTCIRKLTIQT